MYLAKNVSGRQGLFIGVRGVQRRYHRLFDFRARKFVHSCSKGLQVEICCRLTTVFQVYAKYRRSNFRVRQVDKKDLIEATFTYEFWRQCADIVSRCDNEDFAIFFRQPAQEASQDPLRSPGFTTLSGETFLNFVDLQDAGRHNVGRF